MIELSPEQAQAVKAGSQPPEGGSGGLTGEDFFARGVRPALVKLGPGLS